MAAWRDGGWLRWSRPNPLLPWSAEELREALGHVAGAPLTRAQQVDAMLAPDLCRHWLLAPVAGARSWRELEAVARGRCAQLFGAPPEGGGWMVAVEGRPSAALLCAGVSERWLDWQRSLHTEQRVELRLRSAFQRVLNARPHTSAGWAAWRTPGFQTVVGWEGAKFRSWSCLPVVGEADTGQTGLQPAVQREQLLQGELPSVWHALTAAAPALSCEAAWASWAGHAAEPLQWQQVQPLIACAA